MGNCLVLQEKASTIVMKTSCEIIEQKSPIKNLNPNVQVLQNHLNLAMKTMKKEKRVRFSDKVLGGEGVVRVKVVISKKELQQMLSEGGEVSVDGIILKVQNPDIRNKAEVITKGWFPALESIPEI